VRAPLDRARWRKASRTIHTELSVIRGLKGEGVFRGGPRAPLYGRPRGGGGGELRDSANEYRSAQEPK
jgi:hypothetical protein